ncbi:MAG: 30S ribosomal protein S6 [Bacillota bacterium]
MARVRDYETTFILKPELEEETRDNILEKIKNVITSNGGEIKEVDEWGQQSLAYEIDDYRNGDYIVIKFRAGTDIIDELERNLQVIIQVLRYLVVRDE